MRVKLKEAFDLQMGKTPARNNVEFWDGTHKWISISDLGNAGKYIDSTKEGISDEGIKSSGIKVVPKGTVVMSFKLSIGKVAITTEDMYTNEAIMAFLSKGMYEIDVDYLYYLCCGTNWNIGTNKAVMGLTLNKATLSEYEIGLPDISEQHKIVRNLDKLDILISKRKEQVATLDNLTKSRFIEMFNGKGYPEKQLSEVCKKITDGTHKTPKYLGEGVTFISAKNIINGRLDFSDVKYISEAEYQEIQKRCQTEKGDVLLAKSGSLGMTAIVETDESLGLFESLAILKYDRMLLNGVFLCRQMQSDAVQSQLMSNAKGIAVKHLHLNVIAKTKIIVPSIKLQQQFATFVAQVDKSKLAVQKSLEELETLKKSLMQEYFG